jgi:hypothetical protein
LAAYIGFIVLANIGYRVSEWRKSWVACPHNIPGGALHKRCVECGIEHARAEVEREQALRTAQIRYEADSLRQWEAVRLGTLIVPTMEELRLLTPPQFEDQIASMFRRMGYSVEQTPYSNDRGRDAILIKGNEKYLVECKRYAESQRSSRPDLQKFHSAIITDRASKGFFVTTGGFTNEAREFAATVSDVHIELVEGPQLRRYMLESLPATPQDDRFRSICLSCGATVFHSLRAPQDVSCPNGHMVAPSLNLDTVLGVIPGSPPSCPRCGGSMRARHGRHGPFWGCSRYPRCRETRRYAL